MARIETVIHDIGDLSREIGKLHESKLQWLYRGQADAKWNLQPSIQRGYTPQQEHYLTNEFRVRARSRYADCPGNTDYPAWLALMQHYGLPTRLMDWTYSPLIAAFFALHPDYASKQSAPCDASIWALAADKFNESQGFEPLLFPLDASSYQALIEPAFKNRPEQNTIGAAMALEHDPRIQLQQGAFTIHSARTPINLLKDSDAWLHRLVIRKESANSFFDELCRLGVRKFNLFPDLSSLTAELKSVHRPA